MNCMNSSFLYSVKIIYYCITIYYHFSSLKPDHEDPGVDIVLGLRGCAVLIGGQSISGSACSKDLRIWAGGSDEASLIPPASAEWLLTGPVSG